MTLSNGWSLLIETECYRGGKFLSGGSLRNIDLINGIREINVYLTTGSVKLSYGLDKYDGSIEYIDYCASNQNIRGIFNKFHPNYFKLEFTADAVINYFDISYNCSSDIYDSPSISINVTNWNDENVIATNRDLYIVSQSLFGNSLPYLMEYDSPNSVFYIPLSNISLGIYQYDIYAVNKNAAFTTEHPSIEGTKEVTIDGSKIYSEHLSFNKFIDGDDDDPEEKDLD